jgi:SAM-dependent methyltransferase
MDAAKAMDWWNHEHCERPLKWLGDTAPDVVFRTHGLSERDLAGLSVLDIGVGTGRMSDRLRGLGCEVTSVDIAPEALARSSAQKKLLTWNLREAKPVDVAIIHLVFQHCEDDEVLRLLRESPLAFDGYISAQWGIRVGAAEDQERKLILRSEAEAVSLIAESGMRAIMSKSTDWDGQGVRWLVTQLTRWT